MTYGIFNAKTNYENAIGDIVDHSTEGYDELTTREQYAQLTEEDRNARVREYLTWHSVDRFGATLGEYNINPDQFDKEIIDECIKRAVESVISDHNRYLEIELARELFQHYDLR